MRGTRTYFNVAAFCECESLAFIRIPSTVYYIAADAFNKCTSLVEIEFSEVSLPWWNHGASKASLWTYSFLVEGNILACLGTIKVQKWKDNIYNMLQRIPEMWIVDEEEDNDEEEEEESGYTYYFGDPIESQLSYYEYLHGVALFLELAIWKVKITEQSNGNLIDDDTKMLCRIDSISMFAIIFPNVISFFFEE